MKEETRLVHGHKGIDSNTGAISFPIYQSATFCHPGFNQSTGYAYSREKNLKALLPYSKKVHDVGLFLQGWQLFAV